MASAFSGRGIGLMRAWYSFGTFTSRPEMHPTLGVREPHMDEPTSHAVGGVRRPRLAVAGLLLAASALGAWSGVARGQTHQIDGQRAQIRQLEAGLLQVDAQAQQASEAYSEADAHVTELRGRIAKNAVDRVAARKHMLRSQDVLAKRLVALYAQDNPSVIEMMLSSGSLVDAVDNAEMMRRIERQDQAVLRAAMRDRERLVKLRTQLVADQAEAAQTRREMQARVRHLQSLAAQRQSLLSDARATLVSMEQAERDRQARAAAAAQVAAVTRAQRQATAQADGSQSPVSPPATPAPDTTPVSSSPSTGSSPHLQRIAQCESGGNPAAVSPGGQYRGKYQFDPATWRAVGGSGDPASAPEAEQDRRAAILYSRTGPSSWPVCGAR